MAFDLKYSDITQKIIGCAMLVHRKMKAGYSELIYSRCLAIEFDKINLSYKRELELPIYYDETIVGKRRVDFMVDDKIVVELKAISELTDKELNQALNYLENHRKEVGLLLNFGAKSLQFKRVINSNMAVQASSPINPYKNPINP
ncbi:MAG TPA: GxxExxY protein [Flavisolibacter sp.]|nr:GxxExxY protein [Flavisolibacter sp.]